MATEQFTEPKTSEDYPSFVAGEKDTESIKEVLDTFEKGRNVLNKGYNYFGGRNLKEVIDDWTKRWNGYIPPMSPLLDQTQSNIFINFTRNAIISYLAKVALSPVKSHIIAVNKKSGLPNKKFAKTLEDLNTFSLREENGDARFLEAALECVTKGTVVVYEGYKKEEQEMKSPMEFDAVTGELKWKKEKRILFDNCYQEVIPLEDFFITNPFESDVQKQPKVIWRKITTHSEAEAEFGHYQNFKFVRPGQYTIANEVSTFYKNELMTTLGSDQVEILKYYSRSKNRYIVLINGVPVYDNVIPFKDGRYPFAKTINEPFANNFFYGNGHPNKYMGEQDLINTFINAMADKTINSLLPTGLSSDLDDLIEDDSMEIGKFRQVSNIENWKWWEAPSVGAGEQNMFNTVLGLARESAATDAGSQTTPRGGKMQTRQILLKQQEVMQKLSFNMNFLEDLERDRTILRISHILQFYSIPKIEKVTGEKGSELAKILYRDIHLSDVKLSDGRQGNKVIKLVGDEVKSEDKRMKIADELSVIEETGEMRGSPTEAIAISVDTFGDFNHLVQVVKYSSYEKNQAIDQASRMEFANWRISMNGLSPIKNPEGLIEYVEEAFDIDTDQFETAPGGVQKPPLVQGQNNGGDAGGSGKPQVLRENAPSSIGQNVAAQI